MTTAIHETQPETAAAPAQPDGGSLPAWAAAATPPPHAQPDWLLVESLDLEAQGVAHKPDGKVVFIDGALPGEWVSVQKGRSKNNWEAATLTSVHQESPLRVTPRCPHFGLHAGACGGCKMQHLHPAAQVAIKQRVLEDNLWHLGKCKAATVLRPIHGPAWGYRWRARLSVRHVPKKGEVLIGFHERKSRYIADMRSCAILPPEVSQLLLPLRALIASLQARDTCPQIELACGDHTIALVLRHLEPLAQSDIDKLHAFAAQHPRVQWWLQPKGPNTAHCISPDTAPLSYSLPEFGITMPFRPTDFTRSTPTSTACWSVAPCNGWMRKSTSASSTGFAGWATSPCPSPRRRAKCWALKAAMPWSPARATTTRPTPPMRTARRLHPRNSWRAICLR